MKNPAWMPGESPQVAQFPRKIILLHRIFTGDAKEASEIRCELNPRATFFFKAQIYHQWFYALLQYQGLEDLELIHLQRLFLIDE